MDHRGTVGHDDRTRRGFRRRGGTRLVARGHPDRSVPRPHQGDADRTAAVPTISFLWQHGSADALSIPQSAKPDFCAARSQAALSIGPLRGGVATGTAVWVVDV